MTWGIFWRGGAQVDLVKQARLSYFKVFELFKPVIFWNILWFYVSKANCGLRACFCEFMACKFSLYFSALKGTMLQERLGVLRSLSNIVCIRHCWEFTLTFGSHEFIWSCGQSPTPSKLPILSMCLHLLYLRTFKFTMTLGQTSINVWWSPSF